MDHQNTTFMTDTTKKSTNERPVSFNFKSNVTKSNTSESIPVLPQPSSNPFQQSTFNVRLILTKVNLLKKDLLLTKSSVG